MTTAAEALLTSGRRPCFLIARTRYLPGSLRVIEDHGKFLKKHENAADLLKHAADLVGSRDIGLHDEPVRATLAYRP